MPRSPRLDSVSALRSTGPRDVELDLSWPDPCRLRSVLSTARCEVAGRDQPGVQMQRCARNSTFVTLALRGTYGPQAVGTRARSRTSDSERHPHLYNTWRQGHTIHRAIRRALCPEACGIQNLGVGVLGPIAMTIRVLPGGIWPRTLPGQT